MREPKPEPTTEFDLRFIDLSTVELIAHIYKLEARVKELEALVASSASTPQSGAGLCGKGQTNF